MKQTIYKTQKRENPYAQVDKSILKNPSLSWKAKGLLTYLLSLPNDWKIYESELVKHSNDGIKALRSAVKELIDAGYMVRNKIRNEKGQYIGYETLVYEVPEVPFSDVGFSDVGFSDVGFSALRKGHTTNIDSTNKDNTKKDYTNELVDDDFPKKEPKDIALDSPPEKETGGRAARPATTAYKEQAVAQYINVRGEPKKYWDYWNMVSEITMNKHYTKEQRLEIIKDLPALYSKELNIPQAKLEKTNKTLIEDAEVNRKMC
jgi:hypothetical protein